MYNWKSQAALTCYGIIFQGPKEAVDDDVREYFLHYPTPGYGTTLDALETLPDNTVRAKLSRLSSCD